MADDDADLAASCYTRAACVRFPFLSSSRNIGTFPAKPGKGVSVIADSAQLPCSSRLKGVPSSGWGKSTRQLSLWMGTRFDFTVSIT